jgi:uncharacterized protein YjbI with pentapeptide repeats
VQAFWPGISLDLTGATLIDFDFRRASVRRARFNGATFQHLALFNEATFHNDAWFERVTFKGDVKFDGATFRGDALFMWTYFEGDASFEKVTFEGDAMFDSTIFYEHASFLKVDFQGVAGFITAGFGDVWFDTAVFHGAVGFRNARFGTSGIDRVSGARVQHLDDSDLNQRRVWPDGWTVQPDLVDPTRGRLERRRSAQDSEPALPASSTGSDHLQNHGTDQTQ